jgi:hypothetical protein
MNGAVLHSLKMNRSNVLLMSLLLVGVAFNIYAFLAFIVYLFVYRLVR